MTCFNKEHYKELKRTAKLDGVKFVSVDYTGEELPHNGFTVAFYEPKPNLRMVEAAVSYCSPEDKFKPKHGKYQALCRFYSGRTVPLPLGRYPISVVGETLRDMFTVY